MFKYRSDLCWFTIFSKSGDERYPKLSKGIKRAKLQYPVIIKEHIYIPRTIYV